MSDHSGGDDAASEEKAFIERELKNMLTSSAASTVVYYQKEFGDELNPRWIKEFEEKGHSVAKVSAADHITDR
jgi:hypothetical protein